AAGVPFGRPSVTSIVADSAEASPWFTTVIERVTRSPSDGSAGFVAAATGARSGACPVGGGFGWTSTVTEARPSFPRSSRTATVARRAPTLVYEIGRAHV